MTETPSRSPNRVIATATRVIELTEQLDQALANASEVAEERSRVLQELLNLTDVRVGAQRNSYVALHEVVSDIVLGTILRAGKGGSTLKQVADAVNERAGRIVASGELEEAIDRLTASREIVSKDDRLFVTWMKRKVTVHRHTITVKEMIVETLREEAEAIGVSALRLKMNERFGRNVDRTTISPMLKRLERDGRVLHEGTKWRINKEAESA